VERDAVVVATCGEREEVFGRARRLLAEQLELQVAQVGVQREALFFVCFVLIWF
jgi:hypothetical protein